jgi:phage shock protein PspC (stress-responsive transcriptional regulator)
LRFFFSVYFIRFFLLVSTLVGADYSRTGGMASTIIVWFICPKNTEDRQKPSRFGTQDPSTVSASRSSFSVPPVFDSF